MEGDYPSPKKSAAEKAATLLLGFKGVLRAKPLEEGEKEELLSAEERSEKKVAFGMCRPYNEGVRLALCRDVSIAVVVDTSEFVYPHEPHMRILFRGSVVGEDVYDKEKAEELKKSKNNVFLWDNFVVYNDRLPRAGNRDEMRLFYLPRSFPELARVMDGVADCIFAETSMEGDSVIKKLLGFPSKDQVVGSCVVGFNLRPKT